MIEPKLYNQLRQLKFTNTEAGITAPTMGRLHGWALRQNEDKNVVSMAVIEDQDGKMHIIDPVDLQFIDTEYHRIADE